MSVLECGRVGCENIMCRRLILGNAAYICDDCYEELVQYKATWPSTMTKDKVRQLIIGFMESESSPIQVDEEGVDEEFRRLTGGEDGD
jgi:hypothetical protein